MGFLAVFVSVGILLFLSIRVMEYLRVLRVDFDILKRIAFEQHQEIVKLQDGSARHSEG